MKKSVLLWTSNHPNGQQEAEHWARRFSEELWDTRLGFDGAKP